MSQHDSLFKEPKVDSKVEEKVCKFEHQATHRLDKSFGG